MPNKVTNPFIISGRYISSEYFCDREAETKELISNIENWRNTVLSSPRRMGKSGLIEHVFSRQEISGKYETFYVDIFASSSLDDFVLLLGKEVVSRLQSRKSKLLESFFAIVSSIRASFRADPLTGMPSFDLSLDAIGSSEKTLEQIFAFLEASDRTCVVAVDEFQQVADYPDGWKTVAKIRTEVQKCKKTRFIFAGSNRRMMGKLFNNPSEPFFMSCSPVPLYAIDRQKYLDFAKAHFNRKGKDISGDCFNTIYDLFDGHTWYVQYLLNRVFEMTEEKETASKEVIGEALDDILGIYNVTFQNLYVQYSERQRALLLAVAREGKVVEILSSEFMAAHNLRSSSSVQGALRPLIESEAIVREESGYYVGNRFFSLWLKRL